MITDRVQALPHSYPEQPRLLSIVSTVFVPSQPIIQYMHLLANAFVHYVILSCFEDAPYRREAHVRAFLQNKHSFRMKNVAFDKALIDHASDHCLDILRL